LSPDDRDLGDVLHHLYVIQEAEAGLQEIAQGKVVPHQAVADVLRRKWQVGRAE